MNVSDAVARRKSCRAFLPDPVPVATIRDLLQRARQAPSGGNLQPWRVWVVTGAARDRLVAAVKDAIAADPFTDESAFPVYPPKLWEPYRTRRFENGEEMYALLGIPRDDKPARLARLAENFSFFGAPAGLFFSLDKGFGPPQFAHLGMFMATLALLAEEAGLATCMQEAWQRRQMTVSACLNLPEDQRLYCGMALGRADTAHPVNAMRATRAEVPNFAEFQED